MRTVLVLVVVVATGLRCGCRNPLVYVQAVVKWVESTAPGGGLVKC